MTEAALQAVRTFVCDQMGYAACCIDGAWTETEIDSAELLEGGYISFGFQIPPGEDAEVTGIRLYDKTDVLWLEQTVRISRAANDQNLYFSVRVKVYAE